MTARLVYVALVSLLLPARAWAQCQPEPRIPFSFDEVLPGFDLGSQVKDADIIVLGTLDEICNRGQASLNETGPLTDTESFPKPLKG